MAQFLDTEGAELPKEYPNDYYFGTHLADHNEGKGPELLLSVPNFIPAKYGTDYNGAGVLRVYLKEVLEEYIENLNNDCFNINELQSVPKFVLWLHDFANRLDRKINPKLP